MTRTSLLTIAVATVLTTVALVPSPSWAGIFDGGSSSSAEETSEPFPKFGLGVRIGGHGFRHVRNERLSWNDCRMDGSGLFATLDFTKHFFTELSVESYHATGKTASHGMDRLSMYVLGAAGARFLPDFIVSPYIQAGIGPEWTRIEVGDHLKTTVLAAPFFGVGGEINLGSFKLGSHLRAYAMGAPNHLHTDTDHDHGSGDAVKIHYETAGQAQFFVRYEF